MNRLSVPIVMISAKVAHLPRNTDQLSGGGSRIRTLEGVAGGFTVRSHWPLGQPAKVVLIIRRAQITSITA
jgi:hypothetical protein